MSFILYTDGSARPNPGDCGCGAVMLDAKSNIVWTLSEYIGEGTNNIGELMAILRGITRSMEIGASDIHVYSDSEMSVELLNGTKHTKKEHLKYYVDRIQKLLAKKNAPKVEFTWVKAHNNHIWNDMADMLANLAIPSVTAPEATREEDVKLYLKCPFAEKDTVKKLGARWDAAKKSWWVADTAANRDTFSQWIP